MAKYNTDNHLILKALTKWDIDHNSYLTLFYTSNKTELSKEKHIKQTELIIYESKQISFKSNYNITFVILKKNRKSKTQTLTQKC